MGNTYFVPRNVKGESRILYIFTMKSFIFTLVAGVIGVLVWMGFKAITGIENLVTMLVFIGVFAGILFLQICDEHGVSEREEPVFFFNGVLISFKYVLSSCKSRDEHNERGFRQMEIRDQRIDAFEFIAGVDEDVRIAG